MEHGEDIGSEQLSSSGIGQSLALRTMEIIEPVVLRIVPRPFKPMFIWILQEVMGQIVQVLLPKLVQEELQKREEKGLIGRTRSEMPNETTLRLQISDNVSDTMTGRALEGINDKCLKLALLDSNGDVVTSGDASSAEVEMLLLDNSNIHEDNTTHDNFVRSIIPTGDKEKPHFSKRVCISLKNGVGNLSGLKLGSGNWIKSCNCRLGARIAQNLGGITVREALTSPFKVIDYRDALYKKHNPPSLTSEVWRLKEICKDGKPCKRLEEKEIKNLQDFLFWLKLKPEELKKISLGSSHGNRKWNITVHHACTCIIDDKKMYSHKSSIEPQMCVIYDVVGDLKGEIVESHFVPFDYMSAERKDRARELLASVLEPSAFAQRYKTSFEDEAALLQQFPIRSSDFDAPANPSIQQLPNGILGYQPHRPSPSTISAGNRSYGLSHSLELAELEIGPTLFPETVGGSSSNIHLNVEVYSDEYCPFDDEFLRDCFSQVDSPMNECNADEGRNKWNIFFCVLKFRKRVAIDIHSPIRKKQRVGDA